MCKYKYHIKGIVWGNCWGGGRCGFRSAELDGTNKQGLIRKARQMLSDGTLDGGMGFESLYGATLSLISTDTIFQNGKYYTNTDNVPLFIGKLSDSEIDTYYENF